MENNFERIKLILERFDNLTDFNKKQVVAYLCGLIDGNLGLLEKELSVIEEYQIKYNQK